MTVTADAMTAFVPSAGSRSPLQFAAVFQSPSPPPASQVDVWARMFWLVKHEAVNARSNLEYLNIFMV